MRYHGGIWPADKPKVTGPALVTKEALMVFWWVNQNQTFAEEFHGGYLWSPKRNRNGARNQFYENMRRVAPGDLVFSFRDTRIGAIGVACSNGYDARKPTEFGQAGAQWSDEGWRVDVRYVELLHPIRPKDHIAAIRPLLPERYSPLQADGGGLQSVYLASLPDPLGNLLLDFLRQSGNQLELGGGPGEVQDGRREEVINREEQQVEERLQGTERQQVILARRGQGIFRQNVQRFEKCCRITGVADPRFLVASHVLPWRHATNEQRLDGENGLLLSPNVDYLFDRGFISFRDDGVLLRAPSVSTDLFRRLGIPLEGEVNCGPFTEGQKNYLREHRRRIFLGPDAGE
jgi:hypothetical protein